MMDHIVIVSFLPFRDELYWSEELQLVVISLRRISGGGSLNSRLCPLAAPESGEVEEGRSNIKDGELLVVPVDCTADVYREITVQQSSLSLLESSLLPRIKDQETADFTAALRWFADWDDCDRDSYEWLSTCSSDGAMSLLRDPARGKTWRQEVWGECPEPIRVLLGGRDKVFLFFLIADRCFSVEDAWQVVRKVGRRLASVDNDSVTAEDGGAICVELTDTQGQLMALISLIRRQKLDVEDKQFRRSASRIGASYQVDLECPSAPQVSPSIKTSSRRSQKHSTGLVYSPNHGLDSDDSSTAKHSRLDQYLQRAREKIPLRRGLLVTAVRRAVASQQLPSATPGTETCTSARDAASADSRISRLSRSRVCMVEKCTVEEVPVVQRATGSEHTSLATTPIQPPPTDRPSILARTVSAGQPRSTVTALSSLAAVSAPAHSTTGVVAVKASSRTPIATHTVVAVDDEVENDSDEGAEVGWGGRGGKKGRVLASLRKDADTDSDATSPKSPIFSLAGSIGVPGTESSVTMAVAELKSDNQDDTSTASAAPEPSLPTVANSLLTVTMQMHHTFVHDSSESYSIPTSQCFPRPSWEESLLQALHKHDYDVEMTLMALETDLESLSMEVQMSKVWDEQKIHLLFRVAR